jgi:hypothetical protein
VTIAWACRDTGEIEHDLGDGLTYGDKVTDPGPDVTVDQDDVNERAHLLPEESAAGSADPHQQAEVILEESAARTDDPEGTQQDSTQTP